MPTMRAAPADCLEAVHLALREACARNAPAELRYTIDGKSLALRTRLLTIAEGCVYVDRPSYADPSDELRPQQTVAVTFTQARARYSFSATVREAARVIHLNAGQRVVCVALGLPASVQTAQRRAAYRVSLAAYQVVPVCCHEADGQHADRAPCDARRFTGRLTNLSVDGLGLVLEVQPVAPVKPGQRLWCEFGLPGIEERLIVLTEVRHCRRIQKGAATQLGLGLIDWSGPAFVGVSPAGMAALGDGRAQRCLTRFVAEAQRRELQRRK